MIFILKLIPKRNKVLLKSNDFLINRLHEHPLNLDFIEIRDNRLIIGGFMRSRCKSSSITLQARLKKFQMR